MKTNKRPETVIKGAAHVTAPRDLVHGYVSDPVLLAEWNNEYTECVLDSDTNPAEPVRFHCTSRRGGEAKWKLTLTGPDDSGITHVNAEIKIKKEAGFRYPRWPQVLSERHREEMLKQSLDRMKGFAESTARDDGNELQPGDKVALLGVYASQFGSYTTLLWQVPALGLTAQAFLMTIVLGTGSPPISHWARYFASALSIIIAYASYHLMHDQRARAINHAELAKRISYKLSLINVVSGSFGLSDAVPRKGTDPQNVWTTNRVIYGIWVVCMALFAITDAFVIISLWSGASLFT
jgi:hypothetical protein